MRIILASSSPYRKKLLTALIPNVLCKPPNIDESLLDNELPTDYVCRLSLEKAKSIAKQVKNGLVIGSDQCAELDNKIICKPNNPDDAFDQLSAVSGKHVKFYTGLCLFNVKNNSYQLCCDTYDVTFRNLSIEQIHSYLQKEQPYDCAGSFKSESLGIALFENMQGKDPNTLIGLPLIELVSMLNNEGVDLLTQ